MKKLADNYELNSQIPNFTRDQFSTIEKLKWNGCEPNTSKSFQNYIDLGHLSFCIEDNKTYIYKGKYDEIKNPNGVDFDARTGYWREFGSLTVGEGFNHFLLYKDSNEIEELPETTHVSKSEFDQLKSQYQTILDNIDSLLSEIIGEE